MSRAALDRTRGDLVLVVDDVPDNLALLQDALEEAGCTVLVATGGEAALQRALQALPDMWDPLESTCRHASLSIL